MKRTIFGVASTAVSGLTNILVQLLAAVLLVPEGFALFSIAAVTSILVLGLGRALVSQVDMLRGSASSNEGASEAALLTTVVVALVAGALLVVGASVSSDMIWLLGIALACASALVLQDCIRHRSFRRGQPQVALVSDVIVLGVSGGGLLLLMRTAPTVQTVLLLWGGATLLGALVGALWLRYLPWRTGLGAAWLWQHRDLVAPGVAEYAMQAGLPYALNFVVLAVGGEEALAGYRLGQLAFAGLGNLAVGINSSVLPQLVDSRDPLRARRAFRGEVLMSTTATVALAILVVAVPDHVGGAVFGENWAAMLPFLAVCAVHGWANAVSIPGFSLLRLLGLAKFSLSVRAGSFLTTLIGTVAVSVSGTAVAVTWAIALPAVLATTARWLRAERALAALLRDGERRWAAGA